MKRLITYLYEYHNGKKGGNAGFLKLDSRGNDCRVQLHLQGNRTENEKGAIYFVVKQGREEGVLLGEIQTLRGSCEGTWMVQTSQIQKSPYNFSQIQGIAIIFPSGRYLASSWVDEPDEEFVRGTFPIWKPKQDNQDNIGKSESSADQVQKSPSQTNSNREQGRSGLANPNLEQRAQVQSNRNRGQDGFGQINPARKQEGTSQVNPNQEQRAQVQSNRNRGQSGFGQINADRKQEGASQTNQEERAQGRSNLDLGQGSPGQINPDREQERSGLANTDQKQRVSERTESNGEQEKGGSGQAVKNLENGGNQQEDVNKAGAASEGVNHNQEGGNGRQTDTDEREPILELVHENTTSERKNEQTQEELQEEIHATSVLPQSDNAFAAFIEDNTPSDVMRMDLNDIHKLPRKNWYLCNNSFVIHGFFNYHYLVLKKISDHGVTKVYLGVPGIYEKPERAMALLFGFPAFEREGGDGKKEDHQAERGEIPEGTFGYWFCLLDI